jgi:PhzF family phenazine biosynthesis protein
MTEILRYAAFTTDPAQGNPAGVVLDARDLDKRRMQRIAADVGYSETAFAVPTGSRRYGLRFFSPLAEVTFCGHATIATAVALAERTGTGDLTFDTPAGEIRLTTAGRAGSIRAELRSVPTTTRPAEDAELDAALKALRWERADLDQAHPAHVAFAGNHHLVLFARTRARLAGLDYDFDGLKVLMTDLDWTTLQLVWKQDDSLFHSRNPFPVGGVFEDPATGAAAAALGGYLRELEPRTGERRLTVVQGEDMGRRSELEVTTFPADPRVSVSGCAVEIGADR